MDPLYLNLTRTEFTLIDTIGDITCEAPSLEDYTWFTLELPNKDGRPGSCIPQGVYKVVLAPSPKFLASKDPWVLQYAKEMPHIIDIPGIDSGRTNIMLHWGNEVSETEGCILLGVTHPRGDFIAKSREAFTGFYQLFYNYMKQGSLYLNVIGGAKLGDKLEDTNQAIHLDAGDN